MHFAVQAGFVGLCSQAAASLVANNGDPFKTIESLMSVDTVKSLATSMISAGVVAKIASGLNIDITKLSKSDLLGRLEYNLAKNSVGAVVNLGMYGKYEQGAIGGVVDALLNSALAPMLDKVDKLTAAADFSESGREWARILVAGGVRGAITGRDTMDGILSGIAEEYVTAKCNSVVAEWEREDKIREMAEALAKDGFVDANKDQASSSSSDVKNKKRVENKVNSKQDEASSSSSAAKKSDNNTCAKATDQLLPDQEQQELLIDKIKAKLKLHRLEQAQATGVLLEIDEPIEQITKKIRNLDKVQLKALEQSFDYLNNPTNFSNKGEIKLTPTALPLLPLGVEVMHLIFGATAGAYLIWKAATETAEKLQEHKKTTADSKTKDQNASSFQAHPMEPNIFVTPPADVAPTKTVFPIDQTNPSPHVFVPTDVDSKIEGYPDQSNEFNRPILLFSKRQGADENRYGGGKNAAHANRDAR
ncbi:MAG TPA: DUF637 domain-containing protein, partial [Methanosarcina sp.]|nr:DUF637 domain-containing protein [Methanosarcina sp.]